MNNMIQIEKLNKNYKILKIEKGLSGFIKSFVAPNYQTVYANKSISFNVKEGDICGLIGLNGAGKSTLIKMMTGVMQPTDGKLIINEINPSKDRIKYVKNIGAVFGQRTQLMWDLPIFHSYEMLKNIYDIPVELYQENIKYYSEVFGLNEFIDRPVRLLSLGQRMRAEIVAAILHDPKILFLDEPTIGLDVLVKKDIRNAIEKMNKTKNTTIILTSHDLDDIEQLTNQIVVLDKGEVLFNGSKDNFIETYQTEKKIIIKVDVNTPWDELEINHNLVKIDDITCSLVVNKDGNIKSLVKELIETYPIVDISIHENSLEDIIHNIYGDKS